MRRACVVLFLAGLLSFAPRLTIGGARNDEITFALKAQSLQPGEAVLLHARSIRPLDRMVITAFEREFPAFTEDEGLEWTGLVGIDLDTKPGRYQIELRGFDKDGAIVAASDTVMVATKNFPTRTLTVEEKYVAPPAEALARIEREREQINAIFALVTPGRLWRGPFLLPVPGSVISTFGKRSIYNGRPRSPHAGVDFRGAAGTPVRAPNAGVIVLAATLYYSGNTIIVDHGLGLYSYFGHMSRFSVKEGDHVEAGDIIGKVGATGVVTGPHLHWTIRLATTRIDPLSLVRLLGR